VLRKNSACNKWGLATTCEARRILLLEIIVRQKPIEVMGLEPMIEDGFHPPRVLWSVQFSASNRPDVVR
jgi:hypothetical protein